jgi:hypothetical protein
MEAPVRRRPTWLRPVGVLATGPLIFVTFLACQEYIFNSPAMRACRTVTVPKKIEISRAADILFVVDNSGSMIEEQTNLARNSSSLCEDQTSAGCTNPCGTETAVQLLKTFMTQGDGRGLPSDRWETLLTTPDSHGHTGEYYKAILDNCGFIERLQLYDNDFQIGIISSDLEDLDRTAGIDCVRPDNRDPVPQRGCLQTEPNPLGGKRVISPRDGTITQISDRFRRAIMNVGVCGSALEQGLDAFKQFLTPGISRGSADCNSDLDLFLRRKPCRKLDGGMVCQTDEQGNPLPDTDAPAPKLVVILLSDEEDCSHYLPGDPNGLGMENRPSNADKCYSQPEVLRPVGEFTEFLRNVKNDPSLVSVATIVGGVRGDGGVFVPGDCRCNGTAAGAAPVEECWGPRGSSINTQKCGRSAPNLYCGALPDINNLSTVGADAGHGECCTADLGSRYFEFARGMDTYLANSICEQNYRDTMVRIADLINEVGVVPLGEAPADLRKMQVEVRREGGEWTNVEPFTKAWNTSLAAARSAPEFLSCTGCPCRLNDAGGGGNCSSEMTCSGYSLIDNCKTVKFHGDSVPPMGADIRVSFLGQAQEGGATCK